MKCRIKRIERDSYFIKNVDIEICPNLWGYRAYAKVFDSVAEGRAAIKLFRLKNVEVEKCK